MRLPPSTFEQRRPLWSDVESLINPGFLTHALSIGSIRLNLRTLGPGDLYMLQARAGDWENPVWKMWFVATSIWMVDGICLLDDPQAVVRMKALVASLPKATRSLLFSLVLGLFSRQGKALGFTMTYCYEDRSRHQWASYAGRPPAEHSGVPGAPRLGTNAVQRLWTAYNQVEDVRIQEHSRWDGIKVTLSPHAPKAAKKMFNRDDQLRKDELSRRQRELDQFYYETLGVVPPRTDAESDALNVASTGPKTERDLAEEMRMWVAGEKDEHDTIIDEYKAQIVAGMEAEFRAREDHMAAVMAAEEEAEKEDYKPQRIVAYDAAQMAEILRQRGYRPGIRTVSEGRGRNALYQKYLATPTAVPPGLRSEGSELVFSEDEV